MTVKQDIAEMAADAERHATGLLTPTAIPRLTIWHSTRATGPTPSIFEPKLYVLLQGRKRMTVGTRSIEFAPGSYAVSAFGLPFTGQVVEATPERPYLGIELGFDPSILASLITDLPETAERSAEPLAVGTVTQQIVAPLRRLVRLLDEPADISILSQQFERELYYRLLQGPTGHTIRQIPHHGRRASQIRAAIDWIRQNPEKPMCVKSISTSVGMSTTSFHRHFKALTSSTPLAYQRHLRLMMARDLITSGAENVTSAAFATGYASPSQFSREYKRLFGIPPIREISRAREPQIA